MDWKQGLTAAVVVGLGYLGFQNVTKGAESFSADTDSVKFARCNNLIQELDKEFNEGSRNTLSKEEWNEVFSKHIVVGTFDAESFAAEPCEHDWEYVRSYGTSFWSGYADEAVEVEVGMAEYRCKNCRKTKEVEIKEDYDAESFASPSITGVPSAGTGSPGQMCEVCNESADLPYDSDHFKECRRCGKSVCHECWDTDIESDEHYYEICGECWIVLDNVARYDAESPDRFPHNPHPNPYQRPKRNAESFSADARELYRTDPNELLNLAKNEGLECSYCGGNSFHEPFAMPYSKATGGATVYYPCSCGETQVVITDKKWGAESFAAEKKSGCMHYKYGKHNWAYLGDGKFCIDCGNHGVWSRWGDNSKWMDDWVKNNLEAESFGAEKNINPNNLRIVNVGVSVVAHDSLSDDDINELVNANMYEGEDMLKEDNHGKRVLDSAVWFTKLGGFEKTQKWITEADRGHLFAESFSADDKKVKQALKRVGPLANEVQEIGKTLKDSLKD